MSRKFIDLRKATSTFGYFSDKKIKISGVKVTDGAGKLRVVSVDKVNETKCYIGFTFSGDEFSFQIPFRGIGLKHLPMIVVSPYSHGPAAPCEVAIAEFGKITVARVKATNNVAFTLAFRGSVYCEIRNIGQMLNKVRHLGYYFELA